MSPEQILAIGQQDIAQTGQFLNLAQLIGAERTARRGERLEQQRINVDKQYKEGLITESQRDRLLNRAKLDWDKKYQSAYLGYLRGRNTIDRMQALAQAEANFIAMEQLESTKAGNEALAEKRRRDAELVEMKISAIKTLRKNPNDEVAQLIAFGYPPSDASHIANSRLTNQQIYQFEATIDRDADDRDKASGAVDGLERALFSSGIDPTFAWAWNPDIIDGQWERISLPVVRGKQVTLSDVYREMYRTGSSKYDTILSYMDQAAFYAEERKKE